MSIRLLNGEFVQWGGRIVRADEIPVGNWFAYKSGSSGPYRVVGQHTDEVVVECTREDMRRYPCEPTHTVIALPDYGPRLLCQSPVSTEANYTPTG